MHPFLLHQNSFKNYVKIHLKTASNWKTGGKDRITNYFFKYIISAQDYLIEHIAQNIKGKYKLNHNDVQAICVLLHKGENKEISNYRPLSLISTDYKCYTPIITQKIYNRLPSSLITTEQLCQLKKWGTLEGLLKD
uniref:LAGLIDADG_2 domain-containing protein n=1 Tax=Strongyloides stercoralis TaxID=6248 RepID=A0A0K0DTV1_STRER